MVRSCALSSVGRRRRLHLTYQVGPPVWPSWHVRSPPGYNISGMERRKVGTFWDWILRLLLISVRPSIRIDICQDYVPGAENDACGNTTDENYETIMIEAESTFIPIHSDTFHLIHTRATTSIHLKPRMKSQTDTHTRTLLQYGVSRHR